MRNESHFELIEHALNSNFRENARFFPDHLAMHVSWKLIGNKSSRISHQIWCNSAGISDIHLYMNSNFGENARFFPGHLAMHVSRKLIENKSYTFHTQICNSAVISGIANFIWELKAGKFLVSGVLWKTFSHFNLHIYSPMHQCIVFARCELARQWGELPRYFGWILALYASAIQNEGEVKTFVTFFASVAWARCVSAMISVHWQFYMEVEMRKTLQRDRREPWNPKPSSSCYRVRLSYAIGSVQISQRFWWPTESKIRIKKIEDEFECMPKMEYASNSIYFRENLRFFRSPGHACKSKTPYACTSTSKWYVASRWFAGSMDVVEANPDGRVCTTEIHQN
mgnify:CR=1 FL=1